MSRECAAVLLFYSTVYINIYAAVLLCECTSTMSQNMTASRATAATANTPQHLLVLDVDHTFIQGITAEHFARYRDVSRWCQSFAYKPSPSRYEKYARRARDRLANEATGKMVHYRIPGDDGETMEFFCALRPCFAELLSHELFTSGVVGVALASANEDERTAAVLTGLDFGHVRAISSSSGHVDNCNNNDSGRVRTTAARMIPRHVFLENHERSRSGNKRIHDMRRWAEAESMLAPGTGRLVFLDDRAPGNVIGEQTCNDYVWCIPPWDLVESLDVLEHDRRTKARAGGVAEDDDGGGDLMGAAWQHERLHAKEQEARHAAWQRQDRELMARVIGVFAEASSTHLK